MSSFPTVHTGCLGNLNDLTRNCCGNALAFAFAFPFAFALKFCLCCSIVDKSNLCGRLKENYFANTFMKDLCWTIVDKSMPWYSIDLSLSEGKFFSIKRFSCPPRLLFQSRFAFMF